MDGVNRAGTVRQVLDCLREEAATLTSGLVKFEADRARRVYLEELFRDLNSTEMSHVDVAARHLPRLAEEYAARVQSVKLCREVPCGFLYTEEAGLELTAIAAIVAFLGHCAARPDAGFTMSGLLGLLDKMVKVRNRVFARLHELSSVASMYGVDVGCLFDGVDDA